MSLIDAVLLGIIQGLTEFIPISSSGHLLLAHNVLGIREAGLSFDVALHIGTLLALLTFFFSDVRDLVKDMVVRGPKSRLAYVIAIATLPAVLFGVLLQSLAETSFRSPYLVAFSLSVMAVIMLLAERYSSNVVNKSNLGDIDLRTGLGVGLAQSVALIPGVSRSGITISAGLFSGLDRVSATRFSFLLSIPITFGAVVKVLTEQTTVDQISQDRGVFVVGIFTAFLSGLVAIKFLLKFVAKRSLNVFAYYRLALAVSVIVLLTVF